jgi:uncharacterized membrane protein
MDHSRPPVRRASRALTATRIHPLHRWLIAIIITREAFTQDGRSNLPIGGSAFMKTDRLIAFTDAVLAIAMTIMVLDLRVSTSSGWDALEPVIPLLVAYALAFINLGIFWTNHHHMLATAGRVSGRALWANLFLLFWLTLVPFVIRWIGLTGFEPLPVASYGAVIVMAALGYLILERELIIAEGTESRIRAVVGSRKKEWASFILYALSLPAAFISPWISIAIYIGVASMWLIPDQRFERWHSLQQLDAHPTSS